MKTMNRIVAVVLLALAWINVAYCSETDKNAALTDERTITCVPKFLDRPMGCEMGVDSEGRQVDLTPILILLVLGDGKGEVSVGWAVYRYGRSNRQSPVELKPDKQYTFVLRKHGDKEYSISKILDDGKVILKDWDPLEPLRELMRLHGAKE